MGGDNSGGVPDYQPWIQTASAQAEELSRNLAEGKDQAIQTARVHINHLYNVSNETLSTAQEYLQKAQGEYKVYEDLVFGKLKEGVWAAIEHPNITYGVGITGALLLMRRPRRFLYRNTVGRLRSEEQMVLSADKQVKDMRQSVDLLKNEGKKLEERAKLAEEELTRGRTKLKNTGSQLRSLVSSVYKTESQARRLMDDLRELPGREALRLRAEVASMASEAKQQRTSLNKRVVKIASQYGVAV
ncbi:hypothetical protein R1sor_007133 [Riccia sorocarpa]|uniref:Peroxin-14 n=1 Tax=Riccia sorocarpa TaxID=122646 RepID=A0ABD3HPJ7_9MARC